jgi:hypothetical protein
LPENQAQVHWLQIGIAPPHHSALSLHKTEELGFTKLPQPSYSLDIAPCDFFLFEYLKKKLQAMNFRCRYGVISVVIAILNEIPVRALSGMFDQ